MDAALTGARIRLAPILMTSFAFILGCVPLWLASGSGGVSRQHPGHDRHRRHARRHARRHFHHPGGFLRGRKNVTRFTRNLRRAGEHSAGARPPQ